MPTRPQPTETPPPALSVVMPVLNEASEIGPLLEAILSQDAPPGGFEVIVADGGSEDRTREIVRELARNHPHLRLLENPRRRSSAGRNVGARAARGRFILFIDGHCRIPRRDYLVRVVELFESTGADCLCRPQPLDELAEGAWPRAIAAARHSPLGHNVASDIYGGQAGFTDPRSAGAAYTKACFEALDGYDERFDACEDVEFNCRVDEAGLRSYLHPDLTIHYRPRSSPGALFRQMFRYGRGRARLMARHPRERPWVLIGLSVLAVVAVAVMVGSGWETTASLIGLGIFSWLFITALEALRLSGRATEIPRIILAFGAIHSGLLAGFLRGLAEAPKFRAPRD